MKSETSLEKSDVHLLPIIMDPNNETCIYSTMIYVKEQALKLGLPTACITFDQPLWLKDVNINYSENLDIVVRLGGFHMLMSFLGSIGMLTEGSGLETVLGEIFADNVFRESVCTCFKRTFYCSCCFNDKTVCGRFS